MFYYGNNTYYFNRYYQKMNENLAKALGITIDKYIEISRNVDMIWLSQSAKTYSDLILELAKQYEGLELALASFIAGNYCGAEMLLQRQMDGSFKKYAKKAFQDLDLFNPESKEN